MSPLPLTSLRPFTPQENTGSAVEAHIASNVGSLPSIVAGAIRMQWRKLHPGENVPWSHERWHRLMAAVKHRRRYKSLAENIVRVGQFMHELRSLGTPLGNLPLSGVKLTPEEKADIAWQVKYFFQDR